MADDTPAPADPPSVPSALEAELRRLADEGAFTPAATRAIEGYGGELLGYLCAITPSNVATYSSARRMSCESCTHLPSSLNTRTAAREVAIAPISESFSPARPTVTAPIGRTVA